MKSKHDYQQELDLNLKNQLEDSKDIVSVFYSPEEGISVGVIFLPVQFLPRHIKSMEEEYDELYRQVTGRKPLSKPPKFFD